MTYHSLKILSNVSPTKISPNGVHSGVDITIQNVNPDGYVYLGGENVSALNYGYRLNPNNAIAWELSGSNSIYAIAESNGLQIAVMTTSLESGN